jgi:hypothetical protein
MSPTCSIETRDESSLILILNEIRFYCEYNKSPNGRYILAFHDGDPFNHVGGHRSKGKGHYFLIEDNVLIVEGQIERPNDGKVANNGTFILNDWLFDSNTISIAYAFDRNGNVLIKKKLKANLLINGLSPTGNYALFKTANSNSTDHNVLLLYDLFSKELVWKKKFTFQNPDVFTLEDLDKIKLHYKDRILIVDWNLNHMYTNNSS